MKRLRDSTDADVSAQRARMLLSAVEPLSESEARMRRVRRAMEEERARRSAVRPQRALVLAGLLMFGGSALAAAQNFGVLSSVLARATRAVQPSASPAPTRSKRPARAKTAAAVREQDAVPAIPAAVTAPGVALSAPAQKPEPTPARLVPERRGKVVRAADNELVRRALKALRRDGDVAFAARLLEEVHQRSPNGALAEEVMSLRIEAALAQDGARAKRYAREYLARYAHGRYRAVAERALGLP